VSRSVSKKAAPLPVLQVCAEIFPLLKTGGLADVAGALPSAVRAQGVDMRVLLPGFAPILAGMVSAREVARLPARGDVPAARLLYGRLPACECDAYVIDAPALYLREGGPYADARQQPFADNHLRFARLGWAAAEIANGVDSQWVPRVVHAHDWHAGLVPTCMRQLAVAARSVFTIHNLAYQGLFPGETFQELGLPAACFAMDGLEFYGQVSFMKAALQDADRITTVSPRYAREIQMAEQGMGLDGLLRSRATRLSGILNGVDTAVWNPARDAAIAAPYTAQDLRGKAVCKASLQAELGLQAAPERLLLTVVSRLTEQKGLPLLQVNLPKLLQRGVQIAMLGSGDAELEQAFTAIAKAHPLQVAVRLGYDEPLAHRLIAGADVILVPSLFEPCGLTQLYGLAYGTLPLVRHVGGLADTVVDCSLEALQEHTASGFVFHDFSPEAMDAALRRAELLYGQPTLWQQLQQTGMAQRHDWEAAATRYAGLYRDCWTAAK
jgi:starch synthase